MRSIPLLALACTACFPFSSPPVPGDTFYRLASVAPEHRFETPPVSGVLVVERIEAAAIYSQRALVYSDDPGHLRLERYHYVHWTDAPPRLLQQELVTHLRAANLASAVTAEAGRLRPDLRIAGSLRRFDRQKAGGGWRVAVSLDLRADPASGDRPVLLRQYESIQPAADASLEATARAFSEATGDVFRRFTADLAKALEAP